MTLPNFLVIGAQKATTSLFHYLRQHPEIYMNSKDPRFFACQGMAADHFRGPGDREIISQKTVTDMDAYRALFAGVSGEKAIGETSPLYLYVPAAAERIKRYIPEGKLIVVLRNPVERAYSAYLLLVRVGVETLSFSQALRAEASRIRRNWHPIWHYKARGFYHPQLTRYYELFEREQLGVYLYDDLIEDAEGTTQSAFRFLGVDDAFVPDTSLKYDDVSSIPKSSTLHRLTRRPNRLKTVLGGVFPRRVRRALKIRLEARNHTTPPPLPDEARQELAGNYRGDILALQALIGRDLSRWVSDGAIVRRST